MFLYILIGMVILIQNLIDASLASLGNSRWPPKSKMAAKNKGNWLNFLNKNYFERVSFYVKEKAKLITMYHYDCKKIQNGCQI